MRSAESGWFLRASAFGRRAQARYLGYGALAAPCFLGEVSHFRVPFDRLRNISQGLARTRQALPLQALEGSPRCALSICLHSCRERWSGPKAVYYPGKPQKKSFDSIQVKSSVLCSSLTKSPLLADAGVAVHHPRGCIWTQQLGHCG